MNPEELKQLLEAHEKASLYAEGWRG